MGLGDYGNSFIKTKYFGHMSGPIMKLSPKSTDEVPSTQQHVQDASVWVSCPISDQRSDLPKPLSQHKRFWVYTAHGWALALKTQREKHVTQESQTWRAGMRVCKGISAGSSGTNHTKTKSICFRSAHQSWPQVVGTDKKASSLF